MKMVLGGKGEWKRVIHVIPKSCNCVAMKGVIFCQVTTLLQSGSKNIQDLNRITFSHPHSITFKGESVRL